MRALIKSCILIAAIIPALPVHAGKFDLQPFELVRSFQRIQDEIALGDRHALGMQKELFSKIRGDLSKVEKGQDWDERNLRAVLTFAVTGGGRGVLLPFESSFADSADYRDLAIKISRLDRTNSTEVFADVDAQSIGGTLGASIALVRGLNNHEDIDATIDDLNYVRLAMPGTLFEESALRGLMKAHRQAGNKKQFLRTASRYARIFGKSPYSIQFANEMVTASLEFDDKDFRNGLVEIIPFLDATAALSLRDRIARSATVNGRQDLFFSIESISVETAPELTMPAPSVSPADQKVLRVYNSLAGYSQGEAASALSDLQLIIPSNLKPENRKLRTITIEALQTILQKDKGSEEMMTSIAPSTEKSMMATDETMSKESETASNVSEQSQKLDQFMDELQGKIDGVDALLEKIE